MSFQKVLLEGESIEAGEEKRILPSLDVSDYDRLHFHISGGNRSIDEMNVKVLFGTPVDGKVLLSDSTVWFEDNVQERDFSYTTPTTYGGTGFVMSVPVVAPQLYDVILKNLGESEKSEVYVTVLGQEI